MKTPTTKDRRVAQHKENPKTGDLSEPEMVEILQDLARNSGSATARIQAIKTLREMRNGEQPPAEGFEGLDELEPRRNYRAKAA